MIGPWIARGVVGLALVATLWFAGPRAYAVLSARFGVAATGPAVDLQRVGVLDAPDWLRGPVLERALRDLEPVLRGRVGLTDEVACAAFRERLLASPWVATARLRRRYPDRFRLHVELRRPVVAVTADRKIVALVDSDGFVLPPPSRRPDLPTVAIPPGIAERFVTPGSVTEEPRVRCAARVAVEWRDSVRPAAEPSLRMLEIDAANLGGRYIADPRYSEVVVAIAGSGGEPVWMQYGRAADDGGPVTANTKAEVLRAVLAKHPGLVGLRGGDLRLRNRWRDCLVPLRVRPESTRPVRRAGTGR